MLRPHNKRPLQGDHQAAIKKYTKALSYLAQMTSPDEEDMAKDLSSSSAQVAEQLKALAVPCLLNRAACSLKLQQPREAIMDCHNVLQTDDSNTKALFRKGQAHVAVRVSCACNNCCGLGNCCNTLPHAELCDGSASCLGMHSMFCICATIA